jgi:hypothetical protein
MDLARAPRRAARKKGSGYENGYCQDTRCVLGLTRSAVKMIEMLHIA